MSWYTYCENNPVSHSDATDLEKIAIVRGNQTDPNDISGITDNIIADYKREHKNEEVVVVDSADEAYKELVDADALIIIGHYTPVEEGPWSPDLAGIEAGDGNLIDPHEISKMRKGKRLKWIHLVGCNTLSNEGNAAAWARIANGNLFGTYGLIALNYYARGMVHLAKYKKGVSRNSKTWWGGRKKWGYRP
jgi:hypothetical protein